MIVQKKFTISEEKFERELFGNFDENIKLIEESLNIDVILREGNVVLLGEEKNVDKALKLMNEYPSTEMEVAVIKNASGKIINAKYAIAETDYENMTFKQ